MNVSLIPHARLSRFLVLMLALFAPVVAFAGWSLPSSPQTGVQQTISWYGSAPAPMVTMLVRAPGSSNWSAIYANGVTNGQASLTATYNFPTAGWWSLEITDYWGATVDSTSLFVSLNTDTQAPSTPGAPVPTGVTPNSISITWTASTDDVGVTSYQVFANGSYAATVSTNHATITNLASNTNYSFQVRAGDAVGHLSSFSTATPISTSAAPVYVNINGWTFPSHPVVGQPYNLTWQGYAYGASYVTLFYRPVGGSWSACGGGGASNGYASASGTWGASAPGLWEFGVGINGAAPTSTSVSITVYSN